MTGLLDEVWTGGVGSVVARKNVFFWHSDTDKPMNFRNFWRGWSGGQRTPEKSRNSSDRGSS